MIPKIIAALRFTHLTWVINGEEGEEDRVHRPVNKSARIVHVSKATHALLQPRTILEYVQKCAGTRTGHEVAKKAIVDDRDTVLVALKAGTVDTARREVVGILSTSDVDSQNEAIDPAALRAATLDLAARVGSKAFAVDVNHDPKRVLDESQVALKAVWPGTGGVGVDGATYCLWSFPEGSTLWDAVKAGRCSGFSFAAPISYES